MSEQAVVLLNRLVLEATESIEDEPDMTREERNLLMVKEDIAKGAFKVPSTDTIVALEDIQPAIEGAIGLSGTTVVKPKNKVIALPARNGEGYDCFVGLVVNDFDDEFDDLVEQDENWGHFFLHTLLSGLGYSCTHFVEASMNGYFIELVIVTSDPSQARPAIKAIMNAVVNQFGDAPFGFEISSSDEADTLNGIKRLPLPIDSTRQLLSKEHGRIVFKNAVLDKDVVLCLTGSRATIVFNNTSIMADDIASFQTLFVESAGMLDTKMKVEFGPGLARHPPLGVLAEGIRRGTIVKLHFNQCGLLPNLERPKVKKLEDVELTEVEKLSYRTPEEIATRKRQKIDEEKAAFTLEERKRRNDCKQLCEAARDFGVPVTLSDFCPDWNKARLDCGVAVSNLYVLFAACAVFWNLFF